MCDLIGHSCRFHKGGSEATKELYKAIYRKIPSQASVTVGEVYLWCGGGEASRKS